MGYGGYVAAKLPPPKPSDVEAAVMQVKSLEALEMVHKLTYNTAVQPHETKFRRVRLTNPKVKEVLGDCPGALEAMQALGWAVDEAEPEFMVVPPGKYLKMEQVRIVEGVRDRLAKELKDLARHNTAAIVAN